VTKITKIRRLNGLSQKRLAAAVGISLTQMNLIENLRYKPRPVTLIKIARVLEADPAELLLPWDELNE